MNKKYIFLDLDDTIWDFRTNSRLSLSDAFYEFHIDKYCHSFSDFFNSYITLNNELWRQYGLGELSKTELQFQRFFLPLEKYKVPDALSLSKEVGDRYLEILPTKKELVPHAKELVEYLSKKYVLSIVSNGFTEVQYKKLKNTGLDAFFTHVVLSEDAKALKPDRKIFEYALELNNAKAEDSVMIGDNYDADVKGAINAQIDCIYFDSNSQSESTVSENSSKLVIVNTLTDVYAYL